MSADTVLRGVCAGSGWVAMARIETSRARFVGDIASPSCGTLLRKDKPHLVLRETGIAASLPGRRWPNANLANTRLFVHHLPYAILDEDG